MKWSEPIDMYCERSGQELWAEPANALSNLAFIAVALLLWRRHGRRAGADLRLLFALIAAVGLASLAFHTLATRGAALLDIGFIALFVLSYFQRFQVRVLGLGEGAAWRGLGVFALLAGLFGMALGVLPPLPLNGSEIYLAPFALLLSCARRARPHGGESAAWLRWASGLFVLSFTCRSVDLALCSAWPLGTHLGWHLLNAGVLYCCMQGLLAAPALSRGGPEGWPTRDDACAASRRPAPARPRTGR